MVSFKDLFALVTRISHLKKIGIAMSSDDEELDLAVLNFVNTFPSVGQTHSISDLRDCSILYQCLLSIDNDYFSGYMVAQGCPIPNARLLLDKLDGYFRESFSKKISVHSIRHERLEDKDDWREELIKIVELVIGSAVMCENKAIFIRNIFSLDATSQAILKVFVERFMKGLQDIDNAHDSDSSEGEEDHKVSDEEFLRMQVC